MTELSRRPLANSGLEVSIMSLGSWRTFERMPFNEALAVMKAARLAGINFLDDCRYDDETGDAPIPTGYSEVLFGELFRATGWERDEVVVANKLWWEHWPTEDAVTELQGSLDRMRLEQVDLIYAIAPPKGLSITTVVEQVGRCMENGQAKTWGCGMWSAADLHSALAICDEKGVARPVAAQMATSLVEHETPNEPEMLRALRDGPIGLVASYVLAGGTLTGKYLAGETGRATDDENGTIVKGKSLAQQIVDLAEEWSVPPAHIAFAYAFCHESLASIVFGATSVAQLTSNVEAFSTFEGLTDDQRTQVVALAS